MIEIPIPFVHSVHLAALVALAIAVAGGLLAMLFEGTGDHQGEQERSALYDLPDQLKTELPAEGPRIDAIWSVCHARSLVRNRAWHRSEVRFHSVVAVFAAQGVFLQAMARGYLLSGLAAGVLFGLAHACLRFGLFRLVLNVRRKGAGSADVARHGLSYKIPGGWKGLALSTAAAPLLWGIGLFLAR